MRRLQLLQAHDVGLGPLQPSEQDRQAPLDVVDVEGGDLQGRRGDPMDGQAGLSQSMLRHASRLIGHRIVQGIDDVHAIAQCRDALGWNRKRTGAARRRAGNSSPKVPSSNDTTPTPVSCSGWLRNSSDSPGNARAACNSETIRVPSTPRWSARCSRALLRRAIEVHDVVVAVRSNAADAGDHDAIGHGFISRVASIRQAVRSHVQDGNV